MTKIAISGAGGRMGQRLLALADQDPELTLVQAVEWPGYPGLGNPVSTGGVPLARGGAVVFSKDFAAGADVLIDFSSPENAVANAAKAAEYGTAFVLGTTGLSKDQQAAVAAAAQKIPVMHAANYSLGLNALLELLSQAARVLGDEYNIEIVEAHHNRKVDAPSGTALVMAKAVAQPLNRDMDKDLVCGRSGQPGARTVREIGMHSLRMGAVVGDHTAYFCNDFEYIALSHHAQSRDVFAAGALRAAKWLVGQKPGLHPIKEMLFG